jgi:hypothetical protein
VAAVVQVLVVLVLVSLEQQTLVAVVVLLVGLVVEHLLAGLEVQVLLSCVTRKAHP